MKLLLDTNIILDVLLARGQWAVSAAKLLSAIDANEAIGYVAGHTVTTIHYLVTQSRSRAVAGMAVVDLLGIVEVVPVTRDDFFQAAAMPIGDFEDAVQVVAALKIGADYIVTRNDRDFRSTPGATATPPTILALLARP